MFTNMKSWARKAFHASYWKSVFISLIYSMSTYVVVSMMSCFFGIFGVFVVLANEGSVDEYIEILMVCLIYFFFASVVAVIAFLIKVYLINPLEIGCKQYYREGLYKNRVSVLCARDIYIGIWYSLCTLVYMIVVFAMMAAVEAMVGAVSVPGAVVVAVLCVLIFFVCFIPAYIKMLHYMFVPYILLDNPDMPKKQVFDVSKEMMQGKIWNTTILFLSFAGWFLLASCTYRLLNIFYVGPYLNYTLTAYYEEIRKKITV